MRQERLGGERVENAYGIDISNDTMLSYRVHPAPPIHSKQA